MVYVMCPFCCEDVKVKKSVHNIVINIYTRQAVVPPPIYRFPRIFEVGKSDELLSCIYSYICTLCEYIWETD